MRRLLTTALAALFVALTAFPTAAQFDGGPGSRPRPGVAMSHGGQPGAVLLRQFTIPSGGLASIPFTSLISPLYDEYQIDFVNLLVGTNGAVTGIQLSSDNGATWIATGYEYAILDYTSANFGRYVFSSSTTSMVVCDTGYSTATGALNGTGILANPLSTTTDKTLQMERIERLSDGNRYGGFSRSWYTGATGAMNAFRVTVNTGVLTSGIIRVYGIVNR